MICTDCGCDRRPACVMSAGESLCGTCLAIRGHELDSSKIDFFIWEHTPYSQLVIGVYPEGTTQEEVEVVCRRYGTFGGYFRRFGDGRFAYVAWTD